MLISVALSSAYDKEYLGDTASGFIGYMRDFRIFIGSSLSNIAFPGIEIDTSKLINTVLFSIDFSSCMSISTYGVGISTLLYLDSSFPPTCLVPVSPPSCAANEYLFSPSNTCYSKQILISK